MGSSWRAEGSSVCAVIGVLFARWEKEQVVEDQS